MPQVHPLVKQLPTELQKDVLNTLQVLKDRLKTYCHNLTPEERSKYGSIHDTFKLFTEKSMEYYENQPRLASPDVDWATQSGSWETRQMLVSIAHMLEGLSEMVTDTQKLHDYNLFDNALTDYDYTAYKAQSTSDADGYTSKFEELKRFFPGRGAATSTASTTSS